MLFRSNTLIATTACIGGELSQYILRLHRAEIENNSTEIDRAKSKIVEFVDFLKQCFGEYLFFEIAPNTSEDQRIVNRRMKILSQYFNIPLIYATDSHYLKKEDRFVHKAFLNSKQGEREVDDFYATSYMMTLEEVWEFLRLDFTREEFDEMTAQSRRILDWVEFYDLYRPQTIPLVEVSPHYIERPIIGKYEYLIRMIMSESVQDQSWLTTCINRLVEKSLVNDTYLERLNEEAKELLGISETLNIRMTSYYNTMAKIIELIWDKGDSLVGVARGSATGFLSCYLLGITQLDPIKWKLPHWRHLTATRPELPDIDFDIIFLVREKFFDEFPISLFKKKYPNAKIFGVLKELYFVDENLRCKALAECDEILLPFSHKYIHYQYQQYTNRKTTWLPHPYDINFLYNKFYKQERTHDIFSYVSTTLPELRRANTEQFTQYIAHKYNLSVKRIKTDNWSEFMHELSTCKYIFNLDPIQTSGNTGIQSAILGVCGIGAAACSNQHLFPNKIGRAHV